MCSVDLLLSLRCFKDFLDVVPVADDVFFLSVPRFCFAPFVAATFIFFGDVPTFGVARDFDFTFFVPILAAADEVDFCFVDAFFICEIMIGLNTV